MRWGTQHSSPGKLHTSDDLTDAGYLQCHLSACMPLLMPHAQVVDPDAQPNNSPFISRIQQCFAVRGGADQLLDVARMSFCRITDQVGHQLIEQDLIAAETLLACLDDFRLPQIQLQVARLTIQHG
jgi:hypothetical protein